MYINIQYTYHTYKCVRHCKSKASVCSFENRSATRIFLLHVISSASILTFLEPIELAELMQIFAPKLNSYICL